MEPPPSRSPAASYEPRRFKGTVPYYARFQLAYPPRLIARVIALTGLTQGDAVLDLGCGTGFLAIPFAAAGMAVTAGDPEPDMLAATERAARAQGVTLNLWHGGSFDITSAMGPFRLVAMGRTFHWTDRAATLAMLDRIVAPGGAVALFHDAHPDVAENRWFKSLRAIGDRHGRDPAASTTERRAGVHRRYEPYFFASAFTMLDGLSVTLRRPITADEIVGRAFSLSSLSPEKLGERTNAFETELRAGLQMLSPEGHFTEIVELVALVARREDSTA